MNYAFQRSTSDLVSHNRGDWANFQMSLNYIPPLPQPPPAPSPISPQVNSTNNSHGQNQSNITNTTTSTTSKYVLPPNNSQ